MACGTGLVGRQPGHLTPAHRKGSLVGPELTGVRGVSWGWQGGGTSGLQHNAEDVKLVQGALVGKCWYRRPRPRSSWKRSASVHLGAQARF